MELTWDEVEESKQSKPSIWKTVNAWEKKYKNKHDYSYSEVETMVFSVLDGLPELNEEALRTEMQSMNIFMSENPTTFEINENLAKLQAFRARASDIVNEINRAYDMRKRMQDMLCESSQFISKQSSADKRKGEVDMRYPIQIIKLSLIEGLKKEAEAKLKDLVAQNEAVSRQASVLNMQISLGEYRKKHPHEFANNVENESKDYKSGALDIWNEI